MSADLSAFSEQTQRWFEATFASATEIQRQGWDVIQRGQHALLVAPTGSGKTLAAFLWSIDRCLSLEADALPGTRVIYISPLKALAYDVERNLRAPLVGIGRAEEALQIEGRDVRVDVRTGDTSQQEREKQRRNPAEILVTTPESLYLMVGSRARENLRHVHTIIVDEAHALAPTKRGVHLALTLERVAELADSDPQRIGLSATARPTSTVAEFVAGTRPIEVVDAGEPPALELEIPKVPARPPVSPQKDADETSVLGELYTSSPVDAEQPRADLDHEVLEQIRAHRSTIVFVNSRSVAERMATSLNELAEEEIAVAHHGSVAPTRRAQIEETLKRGELPAIVATASLELGVDMGAVDLVLMVDSPGSVARGLQRVGRAGHQVDAISRGVLYPRKKSDLGELAVVGARMLAGDLEPVRMPDQCLDVLAQQLLAMVCDEARTVEDLERIVRRAAPYRTLSRALLTNVLDMLSGAYPAHDFADLRPRLSWDRARDLLKPRKGTAMLCRLNAGTIPDRGQYHVHIGEGGPRIGELDEEMVFETRPSEVIMLGTSSWRVLDITRDRVIVEPAPGESGRLPFWRGEGPGRSAGLGRSIGELYRRTLAKPKDERHGFLTDTTPLSQTAAGQLVHLLEEQGQAAVPTDRCIVVERFRDELGDWRICLLSTMGGQVHAPWAMALQTVFSERSGYEVVVTYADDGLVLTFADTDDVPNVDLLFPDPEDLEDLITDQLDGSALFGSNFRENAARALLLPKRNPNARSPLWAQRLRAKNLLAAVMRHADFPIVLETYRQCLRDVFDLDALAELLGAIRTRAVRIETVETPQPSPLARSLVFAHVSSYLYEKDAPLAERRTQALTLDRGLLRELLGHTSLRELLDADVIAAIEDELQMLAEDRRARDADEVHDMLRKLGALDLDAIAMRCTEPPELLLEALAIERRAAQIQVGGAPVWIATQDAGLYRDALGVAVPPGLPAAFLDTVNGPIDELVRRFARNRGPFDLGTLSRALAVAEPTLTAALERLEAAGAVTHGPMRPGATGDDWCDTEVLRRIKRQTLAKLRGEVAPVDASVFSTFLIDWQGVGESDPSAPLLDVIAKLEGVALPWSEWEPSILATRCSVTAQDLDMLSATGQIVWVGVGASGPRDGKVAIYRRESLELLCPQPADSDERDAVQNAILEHLAQQGASFRRAIDKAVIAAHPGVREKELDEALWDLVWHGLVTNDTFAPLRTLTRKRKSSRDRSAGGRWSLVHEPDESVPEPTERTYAIATMLLERYGIVSRSSTSAENIAGGFGDVYRVLSSMEDAGRVRRGMFVGALEGAQFSLPGAVDRMRHPRNEQDTLLLASVDPANPFGALLPWPESPCSKTRPRRTSGSSVVLVSGAPVLWIAASGRRLVTFPAASDTEVLTKALKTARDAPGQRLTSVERIDDLDPDESPFRAALEASGFARDYRGWIASGSPRA